MKLVNRTGRTGSWRRRTSVILLLAALGAAVPFAGAASQPHEQDEPKKSGGSDKEKATAFEVRFVDGSTLKLSLLEEKIELNTAYGKLLVPVAGIRQIEFGWRIADEDAKRIEAAIAELGSSEFNRRKAATDELAALGEKAYPALVKIARENDPDDKANKSPDLEVFRRATELLDKIRQVVPEERLEIPAHDVIHTADSKLAGRITTTALKVRTFQFGDQQLKLATMRSLHSPEAVEPEPANVLPDPGHLYNLSNQVGQTFHFRVTGAAPGRGGIYGTEVYTTDSALAVAAVHAGVLKPGKTGVVKVTILGPVQGFTGSIQNGMTSSTYGSFPGYRIHK